MRPRRNSRAAAAWVLTAIVLCGPRPTSAQVIGVAGATAPAHPGELVALSITTPPDATTVKLTAFDVEWPAVRLAPGQWSGIVGVDLDRVPGTYPFAIVTTGARDAASYRGTLQVAPRAFRTRVLRVAPDYVNPPPELLSRITSEAQFLEATYAAVSSEARWTEGFMRPVPDRANSSFGTRSVFNGEPRSPHAGTDFLSGPGTPIHAPAAGRVVAARDLFFSGNTVIVDHGLGVFSMLAHMSRIDVREGEVVPRGQVVGRVGATGRVTGPHLHWSLRVGAARVDPLSALKLLPAKE